MASKRAIDSFLSCRRIAIVGVSAGWFHGVPRTFRRLGGRLPS